MCVFLAIAVSGIHNCLEGHFTEEDYFASEVASADSTSNPSVTSCWPHCCSTVFDDSGFRSTCELTLDLFEDDLIEERD